MQRSRVPLLLAFLGYAALSLAVFGRSLPADRLFVPLHTERLEPWRSATTPDRQAELARGETAAQSDTLISFRSDDQVALDAFRAGRLPLWNPTNAGGVPYLAQALYGVFYPPNWLKRFADPEHLYAGLAALHHLLAAFFTFLFLRGSRVAGGVSDPAAFLGGLAFGFSGCLIDRAHYYQYIDTVTWLPLGLLFVERWFATRSLASWCGIALATALVLAPGWAQLAAQVVDLWLIAAVLLAARGDLGATRGKVAGAGLVALAAAFAAAWFVPRDWVLAFWPHVALLLVLVASPGKLAFVRRMALFGAALVAGACVLSIQYLPAVEWMSSGARQAVGPDALVALGLRPLYLLAAVVPGMFGAPDYPFLLAHAPLMPLFELLAKWPLAPADVASYAHLGNIVENAMYFGLLPLVLAAVGLFRKSPRRLWLATGLVVWLGLALGLRAVVLPAYTLLPGIQPFPDVRRALVPAVFVACCLAAYGLDRVLGSAAGTANPRPIRALADFVAALGAVLLALALAATDAALMAPFVAHGEEIARALGEAFRVPDAEFAAAATQLRASLLRAGVVALASAAALAVATLRRPTWQRVAPVVAVVALDLVLYAVPRTAPKPAGGFLAPHPMIEHLQRTAGTGAAAGRLARYGGSGITTITLPPNLPGIFGLRDAWSYTVSVSRRWLELGERIDPTMNLNGHLGLLPLQRPEHLASRVLDLMGVRAILGQADVVAVPVPLPDGIVFDGAFGNSWVLRNDRAYPRAFAVGRAHDVTGMEGGALLDRLLDPAFDPRRAALVEFVAPSDRTSSAATTPLTASDAPTAPTAPDDDAAPAPAEVASIRAERPEHVAVAFTEPARAAGWLVLLDTHAPGWTATVDGAAAPVARADYVFRAVPFPAGARAIELRYEPRAVATGAWLGGAVLLAIASALLVAARNRRRAGFTPTAQ